MNTNTKKNKNKSKQNKPQTSQKTEITNSEVENDESKPLDVKCEIKSDERVPEIVSEVTQPVSTKEEDTPKKPKRNRGKKKKNEKEDLFDDDEEQKKEESSNTNTIVVETKCDPETAPKDAKEEMADVKVAPSTRKKKNKKDNKEQSKDMEQQKEPSSKFEVIADHPLKITKLTKSEAENIMSDVKMITCVPIPGEGEQDKKKKNKKKKRSDSEKSEKEEVSCISAFQKILEPREDKKHTMKNDEKPLEGIENVVEEKPKNVVEKVTLDMILKEPGTKTDQTRDSAQEILTDTKNDSGKGKKRNKKDKKYTKSESEDERIKTPEPKKETLKTPETNLETSTTSESKKESLKITELKKDSPKTPEHKYETPKTSEPKIGGQELISREKIEESKNIFPESSTATLPIDKKDSVEISKMEARESQKCKAKIAKPVEKKNEDMEPDPLSKKVTEPEFESSQKSKAKDETSTFEELIKLPIKGEISKMTADLKAQVIIEEEIKDIKTAENIQVIDSSQKKRKKSPKPQRVEEIKIEDKMFQKALAEKKSEPGKEQKTNDPKNQTEDSAKPETKETIEKLTRAVCEIIMDPAKCIEEEKEKTSKAKPIPLPFTETIKIDEMKKSADTSKSADSQKTTEMQKSADTQKSEAKKHESVSEIKESKEKTKGKIGQDTEYSVQVSEKTSQVCEKTGQVTEITGVSEGQQFDRIPTPDGGMGKKRRKSPTQQRKDYDKNQELKDKSSICENITKTVTEDTILKKDDKFQPSPADFKMLKDDQPKETVGSITTDENPGILLLRKLASPLPMIKSAGETALPKSDIVTEEKSKLAEDSKESLQKDDKIPTKVSGKSDSQKSTEKTEPEKTIEKSKPMKDNTKIQNEDKNQAKDRSQKTDLKSKMMEVNQDMEGLRKSIEKSLAELSVMDKTENSTDQQFVEAQYKLQEIKDLAIKQQSNIKEQAILSSTAKIYEAKSSITEKLDKTKLPKMIQPCKDSDTSEKFQPVITAPIALPMTESSKIEPLNTKSEHAEAKSEEILKVSKTPEPPKRDNKGKGKSKKKGKDTEQSGSQVTTVTSTTAATSNTKDAKTSTQEGNRGEKTEQKGQRQKGESQTQEKGKQQSTNVLKNTDPEQKSSTEKSTDKIDFEQIENFEEALTSSAHSVNKSFEMIMTESNDDNINNPEINVTGPLEDDKDKKQTKSNAVEKDKADEQSKNNPVSQPKNLLGHPSIPARSNRMDYKKEKNKTPNSQHAKVKIKDSVSIEKQKESKDTQTENKKKFIKEKSTKDSISTISNDDEEYVYKYSFRRVYLPSACHVCKVDLKQGSQCDSCNLVFYCSPKHKDEDYKQHQALCFAVSTIFKLKDQKHVYANTANITGHDYRLLRMQMIVSCEKVLQRRLIPCEQEMLLYPRICADPACREWRQEKLMDCTGCGQISYCTSNPRHFPTTHQRWCKSYALYHKLVCYQQTEGRLDPRLPTRVMKGVYKIPDKMNEVLASLYEEKIDMSDIQYAALTQIATAPLTAAYFHQLYSNQTNAKTALKKSTFTIHIVGAELQFEADVLNKWEVFFLHLRPDISELRVVLIGADLNPGHLPLDLLGKIKLCEDCRNNKRRMVFDFQDKRSYSEYWSSDFTTPDLVCAFNPSIQRSSVFNGNDQWPSTIKCIFKQRVPFILTSYTLNELHRDLKRIKDINNSDLNFNFVSEPNLNGFASVRPDRNFISDDEMPLLFKNYCCVIVCGDF